MKGHPTCPRCGGEVRPPGLWANHWTCAEHGEVTPLQPPGRPSAAYVAHLVNESAVPMWVPWPLPKGWVVSALLHCADDVSGVRATATVVSGPNPLGGPADLTLVAEEPGIGLGAWLAGLPGPDPGTDLGGTPHARFEVTGHPAPLWSLPTPPDRAAYVGESGGRWLWAVLRPQTAGAMLLEDLAVADLRDLGREADLLPYGALPPWLAAS